MERMQRMRYYGRLIDAYARIGAADFVVSKICQVSAAPSSAFCVRCARLFIPRVNCEARLDGETFAVACMRCKEEFVFSGQKGHGAAARAHREQH